MLAHFDALENGDLVDIILDPDAELGRTAWYIGLGALSTADVVLCDRSGQSLQDLRLVAVVDLEGEQPLLVIEFELLNERELLPQLEEVAVLFGLLGLVGLGVHELVVHIDWHVVVIVHGEVLHREVRRDHRAIQGGPPRDALGSIEGARELLLLENLLDDRLHDRCPGAVAYKLDEVDFVEGETYWEQTRQKMID